MVMRDSGRVDVYMDTTRHLRLRDTELARGRLRVASPGPTAQGVTSHIFHGAAELEALEREHPAWIERMRTTGQLEERIVVQPPRAVQFAFFGFGLGMVALGLLLLLGMLVFAVDLSL